MAEAIGFAASIIAVVGLAGQVIQGCQNIKTWVGDFNSAPKDIQDLIRELNIIEESAKITDMLETKIVRREVDFHLVPALQQCLDAVQELRKYIVNADIAFQERGRSRKSRGWQRLKVMLDKQSIQASVDRLSRAKAQLVVVQSNILLYFSQCQQEQLSDINESLSLSLRTSQNSASVLDCINEVIKGIHHQSEDTAIAVTSLSADVKRHFEETWEPSNMPDMVAGFERTMERVLQKYVDQASHAHERRPKTELGPCMSIGIAEQDTPGQELSAALRGHHYHTKRKFLCRTSVIKVSRITSTTDVQLEEKEKTNGMKRTTEADRSYRYITSLDILIDLGLWRRGLKAVMGRSTRPCSPHLDFRLSTYHIVDENAPVFQAAQSFDVETVRTLFTSGCASPFDQTTMGYSIFDWVFCNLCYSSQLSDAIKGLELLKLLLSCGGTPTSLADKQQPGNFPWIEIASRERMPPEIQQIVAEAIRLTFQASSQDPISNWNVGICMTIKSQKTPVGEVVRQQNQWPVELGLQCGNIQGAFMIVENDRQILEDEDGLLLAPLLMEWTNYTAINPTIRGWWAPSGIHSLLHLYHGSELKEEIRAGCRNRIIMLLKAGSDPRDLRSCPSYNCTVEDLEMSVTQYALFTNTFDLFQEALENLGWARADVEGLLDEEHYLGVPELLSGELEFRSRTQNRAEFLQIIATGGYGEVSKDMVCNLASYVGMEWDDVYRTIDEGRQAFEMKSTPGSWHEDEVLELVFGVDFFLWGYLRDARRYASFDEYDVSSDEYDMGN